jgi:hypothetical protein
MAVPFEMVNDAPADDAIDELKDLLTALLANR